MHQKYIKNKRILDKSFSLTPLGLLLAACGGGGGGTATSSSTTNTTSNQTTFSYSGAVVKGPLSNSLVFLDYNQDGKLSSGEPTARTDINGNFNLTGNKGSADIVAIADSFTTDQSTGEKLSGVTLKAPNGSKVVSPMTTLMQETGLSKSEVLSALGLPSNIDPTTFNPYAAAVNASQALIYEKVSHQIVNTVKGVSSALETSGLSESEAFDEALDAVTDVIKDKSLGGGTLNFTSEADISDVIAKVDPSNASVKTKFATIKSTVSQAIDNTNEKIADVSDLTSKTSKDTFALSNDLSEQIKSAGTDTAKITFSDKDKITEQLTSGTTTIATSVDSSGPVLNLISVRDNTLNVGETLYVDFSATEASGIDVTQVLFYDANGNQHRAEDRNDDGVAELKITSDMLSGNYTAELVSLMDTTDLNNESIYYKSGVLSGDTKSSTHSINLGSLNFSVNAVDDTGPILTGLSIADDTLIAGQTLTINYSFDEQSDFRNAEFWFYHEDGELLRLYDIVHADVENGTLTYDINSDLRDGNYTLSKMILVDKASVVRSSTYNADGTASGDNIASTHSINFDDVSFLIGEDTQSPILTNTPALNDYTILPGEVLRVSYNATDSSGIASASFEYENSDTGETITLIDDLGRGFVELVITEDMLDGHSTMYRGKSVTLTDGSTNANSVTYGIDDVNWYTTFLVYNENNFKLDSINLSNDTLRAGDTLTINYALNSDHIAERMYVLWYAPGANNGGNGYLRLDDYDLDGQIEWVVPTGTRLGTWDFQEIQVRKDSTMSAINQYNTDQLLRTPYGLTTHDFDFSELAFNIIA